MRAYFLCLIYTHLLTSTHMKHMFVSYSSLLEFWKLTNFVICTIYIYDFFSINTCFIHFNNTIFCFISYHLISCITREPAWYQGRLIPSLSLYNALRDASPPLKLGMLWEMLLHHWNWNFERCFSTNWKFLCSLIPWGITLHFISACSNSIVVVRLKLPIPVM